MLLKSFVLFSFVLLISLNADYLLKQKNRCVVDFWYDQFQRKVYYIYSHDTNSILSTTYTSYDFLPGYDYNSSSKICTLSNPAKMLGLTFTDYNFLIALISIFTGFTFLFFSVYIFVEVSKK